MEQPPLAEQLLALLNGPERAPSRPVTYAPRQQEGLFGLSPQEWRSMAAAIFSAPPNNWVNEGLGMGLAGAFSSRDERRQTDASLRELWGAAGSLGLNPAEQAAIMALPPDQMQAVLSNLLMQGETRARYEPLTDANGNIIALVDPSSGKVINPSDYMPDQPEPRERLRPGDPSVMQRVIDLPDGTVRVLEEYPSDYAGQAWVDAQKAGNEGAGGNLQEWMGAQYGKRSGHSWQPVPEGYNDTYNPPREGPDGQMYVLLPVGPRPRETVEGRRLSGWFKRAANASRLLQTDEASEVLTNDWWGATATSMLGWTGLEGTIVPDEYRRVARAADDFLYVALRNDTGATVREDEGDIYRRIFIPMLGESGPVLQDKAVAREIFLQTLSANGSSEAALLNVIQQGGEIGASITEEMLDDARRRDAEVRAVGGFVGGGVEGDEGGVTLPDGRTISADDIYDALGDPQ